MNTFRTICTAAGLFCLTALNTKTMGQIASGNCGANGNNLTYQITVNGNDTILTISGTGAMTDYTYVSGASTAPWCSNTYRTHLKTLVIGNGVTTIGNYAFYSCAFRGSLTIPNSVTSIGNSAFTNCSGFTGSLTIPNSVTSIGDYAFWSCSGFTGSLTIPNSVTSIGDFVFYNCSGFTGSLTIGNSVDTIGTHAFTNCSGFTGITCLAVSPPRLGSYIFVGVPTTIPLTVPCISLQSYLGWGGFNTFSGNCLPLARVLSNNSSLGVVSDSGGVCFSGTKLTVYAATQTGGIFTGWSDGNTDNPRMITVISDITLTANFISDSTALFKQQLSDLSSQINVLRGDSMQSKMLIKELEAKLDSCKKGLSTKSLSIEESLLRVYPNPTNSQLRIENYELRDGEIEIYDVVGRVVVETLRATSLPVIDISHLENGLYFLKIGDKTIKIIKN